MNLITAVALASVCFARTGWPVEVESALAQAGANRGEVERVLTHYEMLGDKQKLDAAFFLVANMPGQGYIRYALYDEHGGEHAFDALAYKSFGEAQAAMDALEKQFGAVDFKKKDFVEDLTVVSADLLTRHIDLAFDAWRNRPWARGVDFATFCEYVLPYRGSNEPAEDWRTPWTADLPKLLADLPPNATARDVAGRLGAEAARRVGFTDLYYLHPTDQGFAEMSKEHRGRCEDITNMTTYAMRAAGVVSAADYTPWWAHRDNNHAWPVILDGQGRGSSGDGAGAAKVYRKTYSKQRGNLAFQLRAGESAPPWLDRESYIDVTDQYGPTTEVNIALTNSREQRFAYFCVFNGGEWRAIHWSRISAGRASFDRMGLGLLYLPAVWIDGKLQPAAAPLFITRNRDMEPLAASSDTSLTAQLASADPCAREVDAQGHLKSHLEAGAGYELFVWRDGWISLGKQTATAEPLTFTNLPTTGLFWLVKDNSHKLERPFVLRNGAQVWM